MAVTMTVLDGENAPRSGADVLDEVVELITRRLPDVALDDPARAHLERFRVAAAPLSSVLRLVQSPDEGGS